MRVHLTMTEAAWLVSVALMWGHRPLDPPWAMLMAVCIVTTPPAALLVQWRVVVTLAG